MMVASERIDRWRLELVENASSMGDVKQVWDWFRVHFCCLYHVCAVTLGNEIDVLNVGLGACDGLDGTERGYQGLELGENFNNVAAHPNGTIAKVNQIGNCKLSDKIVLYDVLVVPGYQVSLLYVHQLAKVNKMSVCFNENDCVIQNSLLKSQVGNGRQRKCLYFLDLGKRLFNKETNACLVSKCLWHNRLGHPADQVLDVLKNKIDLKGVQSSEPCEVCHRAKQTGDPFPLSEHKTSSLADLVHLDVWGPYKVTSRDGFRFFLTIVDDYSRAVWLFLLKGKDENGMAERKHRHLLNVARSLMFQKGIPLNMWSECVLAAVYLINRLPSAVLSGKCPYEDVKFYETVYPFKNDSLTKEYITEQSGINNLNFFDNQWPSETYDDERDPNDGGGTNSSSVEPVVEAASADPNSTADPSASTRDSKGGADDDGAALNDDEFISEGEGIDLYNVDMLFQENANQDRTKDGQYVRRSSRKSVLPSKLKDFVVDGKVKYGINSVVNYSNLSCDNFSFITNLNKTSKPKTYKEAVLDSKWVKAMNLEIEALNWNNTWTITELPKGRKPISHKWIWKIKYKSTGEIERYKARLMAKGFSQKEGIDYEETFSPVVKMVTVRYVLSLAVQNDWNIFQIDINNTFSYGELVEDVYMTLPEGYFSPIDKRVCKLQKSLYGLKQAPRKWNEKLTSVLVDYGFQQSKNDYSLYTKSKGNSFVILLVYVDDILITGNDITKINLCKDLLSSRFMIKDLGDLKYFLGIEVIKNDKGICLSQRKYSLELLNEFAYKVSPSNPSPPFALHHSQPWMGCFGLCDCARGEVIGAMGSGEGYGIAVECTRDSGFGHKPWGKLIALIANLSRNGSDALTEVHNPDNLNYDLFNQSEQIMTSSEQSND
ncbi:putative RNA-directed DNA polymerase, partial [Tanacetum coccineum]